MSVKPFHWWDVIFQALIKPVLHTFNHPYKCNAYLLYTKQNTDRMLKFDWLRAGPYACVRTGVWTGWTSVHNNKGKHWLFVVLLVWVYNKALINLEFGPYGKYLLWRHAARTSLRSVHTAWHHNKYFRVWTALSVNKSIVFSWMVIDKTTVLNENPERVHVRWIAKARERNWIDWSIECSATPRSFPGISKWWLWYLGTHSVCLQLKDGHAFFERKLGQNKSFFIFLRSRPGSEKRMVFLSKTLQIRACSGEKLQN